MIKSDNEPTEVLAEPPLPTPPAAQPADAEQQADEVVPQEAAPVAPQEAAPVVPQQADQVVPQTAPVAPQEAAPVAPQQADQAMPHNPYAQSHVVPLQTDQVVPQVVPQEAAPVVPQQADQAMPHNPYAQSHVGTSPSQQKEKQVITFDLSDGRLPPPKFIPTAQEMYSELWEAGQRLVDEGLAQKGDAHGAAIAAAGADLMARAAEGMQQCEIPSAAKNFFDGILASLNNAIVEKGDLLSVLQRKPGSGGAPS